MQEHASQELFAFVIGYRIRQRRLLLGLSQQQLAHGIGSQSLISLIESGRQLPLPDVLHLLGKRLEDETLVSYAGVLETEGIEGFELDSSNDEAMLAALRAHRGRWQPIHERIALQLCDHYYNNRIFETLGQICQLILENSKDPNTSGHAAFYLGSLHLHQFQYQEAEHWLTQAENASASFDARLTARLYYNLAYAYSAMDVQVLALWYARRSISTFRELQDYLMQAYGLGLLGLIEHRMQRDRLAKQSLELALDIMKRWDASPTTIGRILSTLATVHLGLGDLDQAEDIAHQTLVLIEPAGDAPSKCVVLQCLAMIAFHRGDVDSGVRQLENAIAEAQGFGDDSHLAALYLLAAESYSTPVLQIRAAEHAMEAAAEGGLPVLEALAAEYLANLKYAAGDDDEARRVQRRALAAYRRHAQRSSMVGELLKHVTYEDADGR